MLKLGKELVHLKVVSSSLFDEWKEPVVETLSLHFPPVLDPIHVQLHVVLSCKFEEEKKAV